MTVAILLGALHSLPTASAASGLPAAKPEAVGLSSARLARIAQVLEADVERGRIPGAVVLVARKGRVARFGRHSDPSMRSLVRQAIVDEEVGSP